MRRELFVGYLALAVLALALLRSVMWHPGWWIWSPGAPHSDLAVTHWPNAHFARRVLWEEGRFPLWRSTIMSGVPFAANPLAGLYYPGNWLFLFLPWLPLEVGFNLSAWVHLWLAGATMYALMQCGFDVGGWAAMVAAVVYAASPKLLAHLGAGHVGWAQAWAWLPLVVLCWLQIGESTDEGPDEMGLWAIAGGVVLAVQFLADVRMAVYTLVALVALFLVNVLRRRRGAFRWMALGLFIVTFVGLTACQWVPTAALLTETTRAEMMLDEAAVWSLPGRYLIGLLLADHSGFHEWMTYVGVSTLVLAGFGARWGWSKRGKRWLVGWLVGLLVGSAWFSLGRNGGLFHVLYRIVPGLGLLRVPPRAWVLVVFTVAVLAGLGVEEMRDGRMLGRWSRALLVTAGATPPLLLVGYWLLIEWPPLNLMMFGAVMPLTVIIVGLAGQRKGLRGWVGLAAVLLVVFDLLVVDATLIEARAPEEVFAKGRKAAAWLAEQTDRFRVYSPSYSIPQHVAEKYKVALAGGVDPLQLRVYADYLSRAAGIKTPVGYSVTLPPFPEGSTDVDIALRDVVPDTAMLGQLGVRYVAAAFPIAANTLRPIGQFDGVYVYQNEEAQTAVEVEGSIILANGRTLFRYDPRPVYVGWGVSGVTVIGLVVVGLISWLRRRSGDD